MQPLFSVVIPSYNRWPLVQDAIESVLVQTFPDYEIIVVDDGSSDGSTDKLKNRFGDRIRLIEQENGGVSTARNLGISAARGDYIAYLDSDDLWSSDKLATIAHLVREFARPCFFFSDFQRYEMRTQSLYPESNTELFPRIFQHFRESSPSIYVAEDTAALRCVVDDYPFFPSTFILHRSIHDHFRWDPTVRYSEDFNFVAKIADRYPMVYIDQPLTTVRMHSSNKSANWLAKLLSHMDTLRMVQLRVAGNQEKRHAVRRALGRRHMSAARQLVGEGHPGKAITHFFSALCYPPYYITAIKNLWHKSTSRSGAPTRPHGDGHKPLGGI